MAIVQIQMRRGTAAEWTSADTVLAAGEIGWESDTNKLKIGDGTTAWTSLDYGPAGTVVTVDDTAGGQNGETTLAASSNALYDHGVATTGVHGVGAGTIAKTADIAATKLDDFAAPDDNTDLNASSARHGLLLKLENSGTKYLRDDGTWQTGTGSGITELPFFVVSNTATAIEKLADDVQCDATNDETDIAAMDAAAAKGKVLLSTGSYTIGAALTLNDGSTIIGQGGGILGPATTLNITGTNYSITLSPSGSRIGGLADLTIYTPASFAVPALIVQNSGTDIRGYKVLSGIGVHGYASGVGETGAVDVTAGSAGIKFVCTGGFNQCVYENLAIYGYEKTFWVYINNTSGYYYMNGNMFNNIACSSGKYLMCFETYSSVGWNAGDFAGNQLSNIILEPWWEDPTTVTNYGIYTLSDYGSGYGRFYSNQIVNCHVWDNDHITEKAILLDGNSYGNRITACFTYGRDSDLGTNNTITRVPV